MLVAVTREPRSDSCSVTVAGYSFTCDVRHTSQLNVQSKTRFCVESFYGNSMSVSVDLSVREFFQQDSDESLCMAYLKGSARSLP
jgi:hypothetical protein